MGKKKQPKFKLGDTVVITMYGTVGNITDIKFLDGAYVYEVNYSEGLYIEKTLQSINEYEGEILYQKEQINIEYKFLLGDLVQVDGYEQDYFKIIGYRTEIWRYKENAWEDVIYELSRISDSEWLEAHEEELTLIADAKRADGIIQKLGLLLSKKNNELAIIDKQNNPGKGERDMTMTKNEKKEMIDGLLDLYNDYCKLYEHFGDDEYRHIMKIALAKIEKAAEEIYPDHKKKQTK